VDSGRVETTSYSLAEGILPFASTISYYLKLSVFGLVVVVVEFDPN
jgi:hypothetical protein